MDALVSVIVPVYKVEKYLSACIDSILCQTYRNLELLLVDDGSTDRSGAICDEYAVKDSRVKVFHQKNAGVCVARNVGLDHANGEWILLFDSDDMVSENLIEYCIRTASEHSLDCFIYKAQYIPDDVFQVDSCVIKSGDIEYMGAEDALRTALIGSKYRMLCWNKIYARHLWQGVRFPAGRKFGDDTSVTYRILAHCQRVGYQEIPLYKYRMHEESALHKKLTMSNLQLFDAYDEMIGFFKEKFPSLTRTAYYAYAIRIFDILPRFFETSDPKPYLKELRKHLSGKYSGLLSTDITKKQKKLLILLGVSPILFQKVWCSR